MAGGLWFMVAAGLGLLGALVVAVLAVLAARGWRVPTVAWAFLPLTAVILGSVGTWLGVQEGLGSLELVADPQSAAALALAQALAAEQAAQWAAAGVLLLAAWGAALGPLFAAGPEVRWTMGAAILAGVLAVIGAGGVVGYGLWNGLVFESLVLGALLLVGGLGVAIGATRSAMHEEHMFRVAGMRFTSAICFFLGMVFASRAAMAGVRRQVYDGIGAAAPHELEALASAHVALQGAAQSVVLLAVVLALLIAVAGFLAELGEVVAKGTVLDGFATGLVVAALFVVRLGTGGAPDALVAQFTWEPAVERAVARAAEVPAALLGSRADLREVRVSSDPFGDVLELRDDRWTRVRQWDGRRWQEDESPLEEIEVTEGRPPLLVVPAAGMASDLVPALQAVPQGSARLLLRTTDLDGSLSPMQLARHLTLLPLELAAGHDPRTQPWLVPGDRVPHLGPVRWYGEGDDAEEAMDRVRAALSAAGTDTLVVVPEPNQRIREVVEVCLAFLEPATGSCAMRPGSPEEVRAEAEDGWEVPRPGSVVITSSVNGEVDAERVEAILAREAGALAWCAEQQQGRVRGRLGLDFEIVRGGGVTDVEAQPRSTLRDEAVAACAIERIEALRMPRHEGADPAQVTLGVLWR